MFNLPKVCGTKKLSVKLQVDEHHNELLEVLKKESEEAGYEIVFTQQAWTPAYFSFREACVYFLAPKAES